MIFTFSSVERVQLAEAAPIDEPDTLVVQEKLQEAEDDDGILARSLSFMEEVSQSIEVAVVPLATVPVLPQKIVCDIAGRLRRIFSRKGDSYLVSYLAAGGRHGSRRIIS